MSADEKKEIATAVDHELALKVYIDALLLEPVVEAQVAAPAEPAVEISVETTPEPPLRQETAYNADEPFECLLFKVAGFLTLAVPLVRLTGILQWNGDTTPIPGHADWFLGLVKNRGRQVKVIDIAKFVIPMNHQSRQALAGERHFKHLLLIDDGGFGLACDDLGEVLKLAPDKVRWRQDRNSRPWLAGTLIEQMSALIDIDKFTEMLKEGVPLDEIS